MAVPLDRWNQFGGNEAGSGFRAVNSTPARTASWHLDLPADTGTSSPAIGPDGTIHIGTRRGHVVAVRPNGSLKWTAAIADNASSVATPAIADDGTVYCLCTKIVRDHRPHPPDFIPAPTSFVVSLDAEGRQRWKVPIRPQASVLKVVNGVIAGAPRVLSLRGQARIFFVVRYTIPIPLPEVNGAGPMSVCHLAIVDESGRFRLFNRYEELKPFIDAHGGGGIGGGATVGSPPNHKGPHLRRGVKACVDTPIVSGSLPFRDPWTIVAAGTSGLYVFRWNDSDGALTGPPRLVSANRSFPAPISCANGLIALVANRQAALVDAQTFAPATPRTAVLGDDATVAGGLRQMYYLLRRGTLIIVDSNAAIGKRQVFEADSVAFPALSGNHVHVATMDGLRTLTLDLNELSNVSFPGAGLSSPAIGPDGSVYVAGAAILFGFVKS